MKRDCEDVRKLSIGRSVQRNSYVFLRDKCSEENLSWDISYFIWYSNHVPELNSTIMASVALGAGGIPVSSHILACDAL